MEGEYERDQSYDYHVTDLCKIGETKMRNRIFQIIESADENDRASVAYDIIMIAIIVIGIIPLAFKVRYPVFFFIDKFVGIAFLIDYILRLWTADIKLKKGMKSFFIYPFTPMALIDLVSIFPLFVSTYHGLRLLRLTRGIRLFRVFRTLKIIRYSKNVDLIIDVIKAQRAPLCAVCSLAVGYVLICALVIFNVEPDTFHTFFDAIYWATVSLATIGYGDLCPTTTIGRLVTVVSSFVGIAIVALPASVITAGYIEKLNEDKDKTNP